MPPGAHTTSPPASTRRAGAAKARARPASSAHARSVRREARGRAPIHRKPRDPHVPVAPQIGENPQAEAARHWILAKTTICRSRHGTKTRDGVALGRDGDASLTRQSMRPTRPAGRQYFPSWDGGRHSSALVPVSSPRHARTPGGDASNTGLGGAPQQHRRPQSNASQPAVRSS